MIRRLSFAGMALFIFFGFFGCSRPVEPVVDDAYLLGTVIRVSIHDDGYGQDLIDTVFDRVAVIEARMSTSEEDYDTTELLAVNRAPAGTPLTVSPDTFEVLTAAHRYSELSSGAFDLTIWPLVRLWKIGSGGTEVPPAEEIAAARELVDYTRLDLPDENRVVLRDEGMGVDVGAIAKGYAADEAEEILRQAGVEHALLDFGGNILVIGAKPDNTPWRIGIQRPDAERSRYVGILRTADRTVVTSGAYERFFVQDGVRYHHIIDPRTGYPSRNGLEQVTVIAERSIDADALSTAGFVLGLVDALELFETISGVEGILVTDDKEVYVTSGLASATYESGEDEAEDTGEERPSTWQGTTEFELTDGEYRLIRR
ncbi:MAG: FAD:protein FMN transferase [Alkalispirochaeta sp.]